MIHVVRGRPPPGVAEAAKRELEAAVAEGTLPRFTFRPDVRDALNAIFHHKCAYCESRFGAMQPFAIEHHRPKSRALGLDGTVAPEHYWWLTGQWTNLLPACMDCGRSKATRFPVLAERAAPLARGAALRRERPLLLDPCLDRPARHFVFTPEGIVQSGTERGQATIDVLALNRALLVSERRAAAAMLSVRLKTLRASLVRLNADSIDPSLDDELSNEFGVLSRMLDDEQPFAALNRQFINRWLAELGIEDAQLPQSLLKIRRKAESMATPVTEERERRTVVRFSEHAARQQDYSVEAETPGQRAAFFTGKKWIEWINLRNFRAIERLDLDFPAPQSEREPWLMMLGENGTGKSSVLRALAIALMGEHHCAELKLDASGFMRRGAKRGAHGRIRVKLANIPEPLEVRFSHSSKGFSFMTPDPKVLLLAYGATRLLRARPDAAGSEPKRIRIENLFDPTAPLADVERWLLDPDELDDTQFGAVGDAFRELLMLTPEDSFSRAGGKVHALLRGEVPIPLEQLSDGFQSVVALCADVMKSLLERFDSMEDAEGIVLLDEIEAHLHPTWKIEIVERLRRTFPRVMFVVSTHDPLCLKGLNEGEIVLLRRDEQRKVVADTDVPPVGDLRADQILTGPLFGLHSTRGDETTGAIERYAELVGKTRPSATERDELEALRTRLETTLSTGDNGRQRRIEQAIWSTLAAGEAPSPPARRRPRKPSADELELRRQLKELLEA